MRTHLIFPMMQKPPAPHPMDFVRAQFANILIDQLGSDPSPEDMDRIERILWGRTFGPSSHGDNG